MSAPLDILINKANEKVANRIERFALCVYNDAKKLTLAAYNWPSRIVSAEMGNLFDLNNYENDDVKKIDLQYVTPYSHSEILKCIVDADAESVP